MAKCIWKVRKKDRRCEFCTYECQERKKPDRDTSVYVTAMEQVAGWRGCSGSCGYWRFDRKEVALMVDPSIWRKYVSIMESIVGGDIRSRSRKRDFVVGRALVAHQLRIDGWTLESIGLALNRDHATVSHALDLARDYMIYPDFAEIWSKFQIKINESH